jgi:hypothetical protein
MSRFGDDFNCLERPFDVSQRGGDWLTKMHETLFEMVGLTEIERARFWETTPIKEE